MRLLIAAGATFSDEQDVPEAIRQLVTAASEIAVMSPSLVGPLHWLTGDVDHARHVANDRLATVLGQLQAEDVTTGSIEGFRGDELLRTAFDDAIREFVPDHVLIVAHADDHKVWERQRVITHLLQTFRLPVTIFIARN